MELHWEKGVEFLPVMV